MAFRHVLITQPGFLKLKQNQLVIEQDAGSVSIPLEDIVTLTLENRETVITIPLLSEAIKRDIAIIICDEKHLPNGIALPFQNHVREFFRIKEQIQMGRPLIKRLWQKIITEKIRNQGKCLKENGFHKDGNYLINMSNTVQSGDTQNTEATAARYYFPALFGSDFAREAIHPINSALDYGYTIVRALIARSLTTFGFIPSIGIHHRNEYNNFNLADDLIEPWRPMVDLLVSCNVELQDNFTLSSELKQEILKIVQMEVKISGKKVNLTNGITISIKSLVSSIINKTESELLLPELLPLRWHSYE